MASKSQKEKLKEKQSKIIELVKLIDLHSKKKLDPVNAMKVQNEQGKVEFRLMQLEELACDAKIEGMTKVLQIMQSIK